MNLETAWGIKPPVPAKGRVINMDERKRYTKRFTRGPEPVTRGTPMPGTMGMIVLKLLGD